MRPRQRQRGEIETLPSGSLRVKVYAGIDPVTKKRHYLTETIPPGPAARKAAERARTKFLSQVDERRNPRSKGTLDDLLDRHVDQLDVDVQTKRGYRNVLNKHVRPFLGTTQAAKIGVEALESLYADARKCRDHCRGRSYIVHCKAEEHECRPTCRPHECKGLADSTIRQIHWVVSGAMDSAVRWGWISVNPCDHAKKPAVPKPNPQPPSAAEAAAIINAAWEWDPEWGAFVWLAMTTGARRGELCALRVRHMGLDLGVIDLHRALYQRDDRSWAEKDTKSHQHRRVVMDPETVEVAEDLVRRRQSDCDAIGAPFTRNEYLFSPSPDGRQFLVPDTATQRYERMVAKLGIDSTLHKLRHYSATELIAAGVDPRTVAGRLGHGGGGSTTLRVYAAWISEADQRAATTLAGRMPARPKAAV
jgi:integrase